MRIYISNNIKITNPTKEMLDYVKENLTIENPTYLITLKRGTTNAYIPKYLKLYTLHSNGSLTLPFGVLRAIYKIYTSSHYQQQEGIELNFHPNHPINLEIKSNLNLTLYDYQLTAINALHNKRNGILISPTGSGKTTIGLMLVYKLKLKTLWIAHTNSLLAQARERAEELFSSTSKTPYAYIREGKVEIGSEITFATIQTLVKCDLLELQNEFDCVIVDECHHCVGSPSIAKMFYKVVNNLNARYKYGLTATIERQDRLEKTAYSLLGEKVYEITNQQVSQYKTFSTYKGVEVLINYDYTNYITADGMFDYSKLINYLSNNERRNNIIVNQLLYYHNSPTKPYQLVLCKLRDHTKLLADLLEQKGLTKNDYQIILGGTKSKDRVINKRIIISTYALMSEGVDFPKWEILHFTLPVKDKRIVIQCKGRIERKDKDNPNKKPLFIDYIDTNISYCKKASKTKQNIMKK